MEADENALPEDLRAEIEEGAARIRHLLELEILKNYTRPYTAILSRDSRN